MLLSTLTPLRRAFAGALLLSLLAACSGGSAKGEDCQGPDCDTCQPLTCGELGAQCGAIDDGCGGALECGDCQGSEMCGAESANVCNLNCGNSVIDDGEECDDGNVITELCQYGEETSCLVCDRLCVEGAGKLHWCGDRAIQADLGEECDDNNAIDWDGCDQECQKNSCIFDEIFSYDNGPFKGSVAVSGSTLYLADGVQVSIYDIATGVPQLVGTFDDGLGQNLDHIAVHQGRLILFGRNTYLSIFDLSDPLAPTLLGSIGEPPILIREIYLAGTRAYLGTHNGFAVIDLANPSSPSLVGGFQSPSSTVVTAIAANSSTVFLATRQGLEIYDIDDLSDPQLLTTWDAPMEGATYWDIKGLELDGARLFVSGGSANFRALDISDPANPIEITSSITTPGPEYPGTILKVSADTLVVPNEEGVFALGHTGGTLNELRGGFPAPRARRIARAGDVIYLTAETPGIDTYTRYFKALRMTCE